MSDILTDGRGRPLTPPEPPATDAPIDVKIAFLRAHAAYSDAVSSLANRAFCKKFRSAQKTLEKITRCGPPQNDYLESVGTMKKPVMASGMTMAAYLDALDAWKAEGDWVPACNGTEVPFLTRGGGKLLYCYNPRSGKHAYLDCLSDIILTDEEARNILGRW